MSETKGKIVDAFAEWDDPHAFRVFLVREVGEDDDMDEESTAMEAVMTGDSVEARLYRAALVKCAKDLSRHVATDKVLGWATKAPAMRVAAAVAEELGAIERGEPGPSGMAVELARAAR